MSAIKLYITPAGTKQIINALRFAARQYKTHRLLSWRLRQLASLIKQDYLRQTQLKSNLFTIGYSRTLQRWQLTDLTTGHRWIYKTKAEAEKMASQLYR